ncbi:MAG: DUF1566 domain-containing protein [Methylococcaceae bacterium]
MSNSSLIHESIKNNAFIKNQEIQLPINDLVQLNLDILNSQSESNDTSISLPITTTELVTNKLGDFLPDGSIVFFVDASLKYGLAAKPKDEIKRSRWPEAKLLASAHGLDWHLPTKEELALLYAQKDVVGGFVSDFVSNSYWSSTEYDSIYAWSQQFSNGKQSSTVKHQTCLVRTVRTFTHTLTTKPTKLVAKSIELATYNLGDILSDGGIVFYVDISGSHGLVTRPANETRFTNWAQAKNFIKLNYIQEWHLPTKDELVLMYHQKNILRGNTHDYYWSATELNSKYVSTLRFHNGDVVTASKDNNFLVRAVRSF